MAEYVSILTIRYACRGVDIPEDKVGVVFLKP